MPYSPISFGHAPEYVADTTPQRIQATDAIVLVWWVYLSPSKWHNNGGPCPVYQISPFFVLCKGAGPDYAGPRVDRFSAAGGAHGRVLGWG